MATFDLEKAAALLGHGNTGVIDSIGMGFGVPNCMLNLTKDVLEILPSDILIGINQNLKEGRESANESFAWAIKNAFLDSGVIEYSTEHGKLRFVSGSSKYGLDKNEEKFIKGLDALANAMAYGGQLWSNYQSIQDQINEVKYCLDLFTKSQKFSSGNSSKFVAGIDFDPNDLPTEVNFEAELGELNGALGFISDSTNVINTINGILSERENNSSLEPVFYDAIDLSGLFPVIASGSPIKVQDGTEFFDLIFGPPKSKSGKFLLSTDGYYYPYTSAIDIEVSNIHAKSLPQKSKRWLLDYDPNLGGKGQAISLASIDKYFNTIFDLNKIDDSKNMQLWYDKDHFLQVIISQKDKNIYDLSGQIIQALGDGEEESSAFVVNLKQALYGTIASHVNKINKRKKQIEIAVKSPALFGEDPKFTVGNIPINDFSYLSEYSIPISLNKQRNLVFKAGDVSGVVLPIKPKFVISKEVSDKINLSHLVIPPIGTGAIINSTSSLDLSAATMLSLTEDIVTDKLISIYNFLEARNTKDPGSTEFKVLNCAAKNMYGNAQLVATYASSVFASGLGIPYLEGVGGYSNSTGSPSSIGSYVRLPDIKEYRDLAYTKNGFSIDFWTHIPDLTTNWGVGQASSLHRVILGCENTGGTLLVDDVNKVRPTPGFESVKGFLMGFTKDVQITKNLTPTDDPLLNPTSSICFYVAPTQSVNRTDIAFVNNSTQENCISNSSYHKMVVDVCSVVNGRRFLNVECDFIHTVLTVEPKKNEVKIYLDGILMATSGIDSVFGVPAFTSPQFPSFHSVSSFNYTTYSGLTNTILSGGPKLDPYFTPFIIGGGYTDGMINHGGFMGLNSGRTSGLKGYLGSFKFYAKALNIQEIRKNYLAQRIFFKNIDTPGCGLAFSEFDIDFLLSGASGAIPLSVSFTGSSTYE